MKFESISKAGLVDLEAARMTEFKKILGVLAGGWLDLKGANHWIRVSGVHLKFDAGKKLFTIAANEKACGNITLFHHTATTLKRYTGANNTSFETAKVIGKTAEHLTIPKGRLRDTLWVLQWKVTAAQIRKLKEYTKDEFTDADRQLFSTIKSIISDQ